MRRKSLLFISIILIMSLPMLSVAVGPDTVSFVRDESDGLIDNSVTRVVRGDLSTKDIYIGTSNGISVYDYLEDEFVNHTTLSTDRNRVQDMVAAVYT